jgi:hypothetical protein
VAVRNWQERNAKNGPKMAAEKKNGRKWPPKKNGQKKTGRKITDRKKKRAEAKNWPKMAK